MDPLNRKTVAGFIEVNNLHSTYFINPTSNRKYKEKQQQIINFLRSIDFQEIHLPFLIPKKFISPIKNVQDELFITAFSGKDKRTIYLLKPFCGFFTGIPFVANNISSYKQLPKYFMDKGPLYGNFPKKWQPLNGSKEDYLGLHGVLISDKENISLLVGKIKKLINSLGIKSIQEHKEQLYKIPCVSFYHQKIFICACFNFKDNLGKSFGIYYNTYDQKLKPVFWQSFYISQNLICLL